MKLITLFLSTLIFLSCSTQKLLHPPFEISIKNDSIDNAKIYLKTSDRLYLGRLRSGEKKTFKIPSFYKISLMIVAENEIGDKEKNSDEFFLDRIEEFNFIIEDKYIRRWLL